MRQSKKTAFACTKNGTMAQRERDTESTAMLIVAAGTSARLGRPKQLLSLEGELLVQHSVRVAREAALGPVLVVVAAHADEVQKSLDAMEVEIIPNADWQEGMAASIRAGISQVQAAHPNAEAVILMMCDQPLVSKKLLQQLYEAHLRTGKPIITCSYADTFGPPTLFHQSMFGELLQLTGDVGARSMIKRHADSVEAIPFPEGVVDVDTDADYQNLLKHQRTT
jgi:molybdenum cofactor cytidylyltransferase